MNIVESGTFEGQHTAKNGVTYTFKAMYRLVGIRVDWSASITGGSGKHALGGTATVGKAGATHNVAFAALIEAIEQNAKKIRVVREVESADEFGFNVRYRTNICLTQA